jgi:hypothetical protein
MAMPKLASNLTLYTDWCFAAATHQPVNLSLAIKK